LKTVASAIACWYEQALTLTPQGGTTWKELVEKGALIGVDAIKPTITAFSWLPYLFNLLAVGSKGTLEVKAEARRLCAWYSF
jgi:hypothetical protein